MLLTTLSAAAVRDALLARAPFPESRPNMSSPAHPPHARGLSRVGFEGLKLPARIGTTAAERARPQPLLVDVWVELELDLKALSERDDLELTLDYAALAEAVRHICAEREYQLIETLAIKIARRCRAHPLARSAHVVIRKPEALPGAVCARFELVL
jgi:7,8-dihydroneopterin aldolase/epimerase/oxygenase